MFKFPRLPKRHTSDFFLKFKANWSFAYKDAPINTFLNVCKGAGERLFNTQYPDYLYLSRSSFKGAKKFRLHYGVLSNKQKVISCTLNQTTFLQYYLKPSNSNDFSFYLLMK
jgi:hypothetical protein